VLLASADDIRAVDEGNETDDCRASTTTVEVDVLVTIPAGVRPGTRLRLRGRARSDGARGDVHLAVEVR